ncbi:VWA domain-containing protein [Pseudomonas sp. 21LCFQ010]|uniref:VWA domain-containing protein n=1 Tax=Pseudomonas sp. 21LCFQ010 TaxID=2957506 RepID=UPI0020984C38|nr:VWA domain-containing protein [Pseudomonas sp. 21LCFQ010]MCO8164107.1 VWA domain-containing protein [Pseudomonas sp. 21LCFQ010]
MLISQGQRVPLSNLISGQTLTLTLAIDSPHIIDYVCFGVDANGKLSDDRYMIFFNQPASPCNSIQQQGNEFRLNLSSLPASIDRLVFTASIDGAGTMQQIRASHFSIGQAGREVARGEFSGSSFNAEKAIMVIDLYRKNGEWRLASNLQGYNAGLDALVVHFGGEVADEPAPAPAPVVATAKISLEKKVAEAAPQLVSLAKKAQVSLEKAQLTDTRARVGLVLDASGSMNGQYSRGHVQEVVDRLLPLAVHFDDDGALDCWAFAAKPMRLTPVTLSNFRDFIKTDHGGWRDWELGSRVNNEPKVMRQVIDFYKQSGDRTPVYILFISDGGVSQNREIIKLMSEAARLPIFWQFVGLGGHGYGVLEKLDDMEGRVVDNCNFFALDRLDEIAEEKLYDLLMEEFPDWLKAAKSAGIL